MADPREGRSLARVFARSQSGHFHAQRSASRVSLHRFISAPQRNSRAACSRRGYATLKTPAAIDAPWRCVRALRPSLRPHPQASGSGNASRQRAEWDAKRRTKEKDRRAHNAGTSSNGCANHKYDHFLLVFSSLFISLIFYGLSSENMLWGYIKFLKSLLNAETQKLVLQSLRRFKIENKTSCCIIMLKSPNPFNRIKLYGPKKYFNQLKIIKK
jgi:hypothetical protein